MLATLRNRDFTLLWLGGLISLAGDWTLNIGLPIALFALTHSILVLSVAMVVAMLPSVLFGSFAGVFVDRWDRRRTLIVSNLLLAALLLPILLVRSDSLVWIVYPIMFLESCLEQFTRPAESALLPSLVGAEHIPPANSLLSVSNNLARLLGPALGGLIAAYFGLTGVALVDGATFLLAALLIALIGWRAPAVSESAASTGEHPFMKGLREWLDGLGVIFRERTLGLIFAVVAITSIGEGVMSVLFVVFVVTNLHGGAQDLGDLMSAQAVGGLIGGVLCGLLGSRLVSRWSLGISAMIFGAIDLAIFNAPRYFAEMVALPWLSWLSPVTLVAFELGLFVMVGIPAVSMLTGLQSLLQLRAPERYLGRVFGALGACMALFAIAGAGIAGWLGPRFGAVTLLNIQGGGYVVVGLILLLFITGAAAMRAPDAPAPGGETASASVTVP
ncbi:MAG TPA: MFS transporter [Ktedonobacterales bacterium]|nr:MFS transporter [Ktedonobacterales bacterium]